MIDKHWHIILNPTAGNGKAEKKWPQIRAYLTALGIHFSFDITEKSGHAVALTKACISESKLNILAIGGDGTNHEVINGILESKVNGITYALIPIGTGNDWARYYGISKNPNKAIDQLMNGVLQYQDIGKIQFTKTKDASIHYFANVAGAAYDAFVVKQMGNTRSFLSGKLIYTLKIVQYLFQYKVQKVKLKLDHKIFDELLYTINIGICKYAGGGLNITPHANPNDGILAVTKVKAMSKLAVLLAMPKFYNGKIGTHIKVNLLKSDVVEIESSDNQILHIEADGEYLGEGPARFTVVKNGIRILVPKKGKEM